jgi:AraC family transcriptional regulator
MAARWQPTVWQYYQQQEGGFPQMEVKIESKSPFMVVGLKYRGKNEQNEIPALWGQLMARFGELANLVQGAGSYGVMDNFDPETGEFDYLAGLPVSSGEQVPEGMELWEIPEQTYGVFTFPFSDIRKGFDYAMKTWPQESGRERTGGIEFEYYSVEFTPEDPASLMQYWMPIK